MKSRLTISIAIVFSVLVLSTTALAQGAMKPIADTGMIKLGPNQVLRLTVPLGSGDDEMRIRFRRMEYIEQGNIYNVAAVNTSAPIVVTAGEAATIQIPNNGAAVRGVVLSDNKDAKVVAIVFDTSTQRITAICTFIPD